MSLGDRSSGVGLEHPFDETPIGVHRQGQTRKVSEVYLLGEVARKRGRPAKTLDHIQLEALQQKQNLADIVTGDKAAQILEDM